MDKARVEVRNFSFNAFVGAFEARVRVNDPKGSEEITARAYLPMLVGRAAAEEALIRVAVRRIANLRSAPSSH